MGQIKTDADQVFRDFEPDGVQPPAGELWEPFKPDIRALFALIDTLLAAVGGMAKATVAQVRAAVADKIITADHLETASAFVTMTDGANIALNWDAGFNRDLLIGGNRTLDNPSNGQPGTWRTIVVTQDGTGSRTLTLDTQYKTPGGTITLSTAAGAVDVLSIHCITATLFHVFSALDLS